MVATTAIPQAVDALYVLLAAALPGVNVLDGPGATDDPGDFVLVGCDNPDADDPAAVEGGQQVWGSLGKYSRMETFTILCCAVSWGGDEVMKTYRDRAFAAYQAAATAIVADPTFGGVLFVVEGIDARAVRPQSGPSGTAVAVEFGVRCKARLT